MFSLTVIDADSAEVSLGLLILHSTLSLSCILYVEEMLGVNVKNQRSIHGRHNSLCQGVVQLGQNNVDRIAVCATAELLLPPGMANTYSFDAVILLNLCLQLRQGAWFSHNDVVAALEVTCDRLRQRWDSSILKQMHASADAGI